MAYALKRWNLPPPGASTSVGPVIGPPPQPVGGKILMIREDSSMLEYPFGPLTKSKAADLLGTAHIAVIRLKDGNQMLARAIPSPGERLNTFATVIAEKFIIGRVLILVGSFRWEDITW